MKLVLCEVKRQKFLHTLRRGAYYPAFPHFMEARLLLHAYNALNKTDFFTLKRADSDDGKKICGQDGDSERELKRRRRV
jgi:hypothetical protein